MVLICDVCRKDVPATTAGTTPTICLFPCFHKYCDLCKGVVFNAARARQQENNGDLRVTCGICNQNFRSNVLYDYSENQFEKIFCLHCNIKNKAPVEWRCKTCQNRFLCVQCSQPHYHSGHELEPVMKPNIPSRSQCTLHPNMPATYLCSCQARLCDFCLNIHANGQNIHPHEQRIPYSRLAQQARNELDNIRQQSKKDFEQIQKIKEITVCNKQSTHAQASQARTTVADHVLELVNAVIRRGNDIVGQIDLIEDTKLKNIAKMEKEMFHWLDRLKKIESFTENALMTVQQDQPGMWSAAMFAQSAFSQVNKRREVAKANFKVLEQAPKIAYHSNLTDLFNSIRSFGLINVDGEVMVPVQSTPQNARMFSIVNSPQLNPSSSNNPGGPSIRQQQHATMEQSTAETLVPHSSIAAVTPQVNVSMQMNAPPLQQRGALSNLPTQPRTLPHQSQIPPQLGGFNTSTIAPNALLPQLLQQQQFFTSTIPHSSVNSVSNTLPSTLVTPQFTPEHLQMMRMRQNTMLRQQSFNNPPEQFHQQQQQALFFQQQRQQQQQIRHQQPIVHQQPPVNRTMHQAFAPHQQQIRSPPIANNQQQNVFLPMAHQMQPHQSDHQQMTAQRQQQVFMQQQAQMRLLSPYPVTSQLREDDAAADRPPILLRIPNPKQTFPQQNMNVGPTTISNAPGARMNTPPQNKTLNQIFSMPPCSSVSINQTLPAEQFQMHIEDQQQFKIQDATRPQDGQIQNLQQEERISPEVVDLLEDEEEVQQQEVQSLEAENFNLTMERITGPIEENMALEDDINQGQQVITNNNNNTIHQQIQPQRQKAQSAAADSTSTNNGTNETHEACSPVVPQPVVGMKRKFEDSSYSGHLEPDQKRPAEEEPSVGAHIALVEEELERQANISPVISTTVEDELNDVQEEGNEDAENGDNADDEPNELVLVIDEGDSSNQHLQEEEGNEEAENGEHIGDELNGLVIDEDNGIQQMREEINEKTENAPHVNDETMPDEIGDRGQSVESGDPTEDNTSEMNEQEAIPVDETQEQDIVRMQNVDEEAKVKSSKCEAPAISPRNNTKCAVVSPIQLVKMISIADNQRDQRHNEAALNTAINEHSSPIKDQYETEQTQPSTSTNIIEAVNASPDRRSRHSEDNWDDYCFVCSQGCDQTTGSLGCCEKCPRVFHASCHVPIIKGRMEDLPDDWRCTICIECEPLKQKSREFGEREKMLCAKVYLACFEEFHQVDAYLNEVPKTEIDYHSVIKQPIWLYAIAKKISKGKYAKVSQFIEDMNLLFKNISTFNPPNAQLAINGRKVYERFMKAVQKFLPGYYKQIWVYISLYNSRHASTAKEEEGDLRKARPGRPRRNIAKSQTP